MPKRRAMGLLALGVLAGLDLVGLWPRLYGQTYFAISAGNLQPGRRLDSQNNIIEEPSPLYGKGQSYGLDIHHFRAVEGMYLGRYQLSAARDSDGYAGRLAEFHSASRMAKVRLWMYQEHPAGTIALGNAYSTVAAQLLVVNDSGLWPQNGRLHFLSETAYAWHAQLDFPRQGPGLGIVHSQGLDDGLAAPYITLINSKQKPLGDSKQWPRSGEVRLQLGPAFWMEQVQESRPREVGGHGLLLMKAKGLTVQMEALTFVGRNRPALSGHLAQTGFWADGKYRAAVAGRTGGLRLQNERAMFNRHHFVFDKSNYLSAEFGARIRPTILKAHFFRYQLLSGNGQQHVSDPQYYYSSTSVRRALHSDKTVTRFSTYLGRDGARISYGIMGLLQKTVLPNLSNPTFAYKRFGVGPHTQLELHRFTRGGENNFWADRMGCKIRLAVHIRYHLQNRLARGPNPQSDGYEESPSHGYRPGGVFYIQRLIMAWPAFQISWNIAAVEPGFFGGFLLFDDWDSGLPKPGSTASGQVSHTNSPLAQIGQSSAEQTSILFPGETAQWIRLVKHFGQGRMGEVSSGLFSGEGRKVWMFRLRFSMSL